MRYRIPSWRLLLFLVLSVGLQSAGAAGQAVRIVSRNRPRLSPNLTIILSLTLSASPSTVNFALVSKGAATGSSAVAITTSYTAISLGGQITLYSYFSSAANALTGGTPSSSIPSSDVFGQVPTGTYTSYTAFTQTTPYSGASGLQIFQIASTTSLGASRTDNLSLKIDLTATPQLPAATYTGTLSLEAQAF